MIKGARLTYLLAAVAVVGTAVFLLITRLHPSRGLYADLPVLVREIQQLNELVSVKYHVQKVVGIEEEKIPVGKEKLLLVVQAQVLAGIDLSKLTVRHIKQSAPREVSIALPQPQILHVSLDEEQTKVWDRRITWWTPWVPFSPDLERQARLAALESVRQTATEMGILRDARRNAEQSIRTLLLALGFQTVTFDDISRWLSGGNSS